VAEWTSRTITDPKALRALAHPLRIELLETLAMHGPATATDLAERVGESAANCSWHLRQLAKHGYVEEAGGGTGRQRPWQIAAVGHYWDSSSPDADLAVAGRAASDAMLARETEALRAYRAIERTEDREWAEASFFNQAITWLTSEELAELGRAVGDLYLRHINRLHDPSARPDGARPVRLVAWSVPARGVASHANA
jgi:DNA-binding transcriptional ArsR family regulator